MKLYYSPGACSLSVHIALCEVGLNYVLEKVDLRSKKTETGQNFLKITAKGQVPALQIDDKVVLTEAAAILQYVADLVPSRKLLAPTGKIERYETVAWLNYVATELHKNFGPIFNPMASSDLKEGAIKVLASKFAYIEKILEKQDYIAANHYTVADCYLFVVLRWCKFIPNLAKYSAIDRYMSRIQSRLAVAKAMREEGL